MMRKKIVSLCMALTLCLSLLPATALAAGDGAPETLFVGGTNVKDGGYWTTTNGTLASSDVNTWNVHYDADSNTLTLKDADITGATLAEIQSLRVGIYASGSSTDVSLNIILQGENNQVSGDVGIYVYSSSTGDASLTISSEDGSNLTASGTSNPGIQVLSNSGNATLAIQNADVTAEVGGYDNGVTVQAGSASSGGHTAKLEVNGGSLTATGGSSSDFGIYFYCPSSSNINLNVSNNAIVRANGGIASGDNEDEPVTPSGTGIVFNNKVGTVYGNVTLQEDLTIGEGESLTLAENASLSAGGHNVIVDGGTVDDSIKTSLGESVKYPPDITTTTLSSGTVNQSYTAQLSATGSDTIKWSLATGSSLPSNLTLSESGEISGTPTATGTSTFTVVATNDYGSDSKELSITIDAQTNVPVTGVTLSQTELSLTEGGTAQLTATVLPDNATNRNVTWSSNAPGVATVDSSGKVTAVAPGTATITVTTVDQSKTATCEVTVTAATVPVTGVTLSQTQASLYYNRTPNTLTLTATVTPDNATNQAVTWTSSNPSVAKVENGVVTALACGTAVITAAAADGSGASASCTVTVSSYLPPANPNYRITVEATQGGTVTADPTAAKAGATVTLPPVPNRGYQVGSVAVTDRFGEAVAVTEQADGTYTFTMPNGQVTVTVTFEETPLPFTDVTEGDWFYDAVRYAYETGLMDGVGDNLFAPNSQTTRAQLVTILYRLAGQPEPGGDSGFSDVETGTWYTDAVAWAAENGIVNGTTDTTFAPGEDITREQLVAVLYRYAESKGYDVSASADLSGYPDAGQVQDYAQPAMAWAVAEGIVEGMDGNLNPAGNATRAQIATILMRFCEGIQP